MATWKDVERSEPEFADRVRKIFDANKHKTLATLRADGAPRISGTECSFADGELTFGSMPRSRKGADLLRDPRFALHSATVDAPDGDDAAWVGDAKVAGRAFHAGDVDGDIEGDLFRADLDQVVLIGLNETATMMVIRTWTPAGGLRTVERT
ncbi:pyridoxamine 5'-phosphate oxidase family protein [Pseudonocardia sp. GCM10023141]|uniref:pyridoxamine 5'-phosphate oxidase family protein n=1 Tax=Pseudonocardia sp. GCM10023141 TaxID=3252653 RepID=UPI003616C71B